MIKIQNKTGYKDIKVQSEMDSIKILGEIENIKIQGTLAQLVAMQGC